MTFRPRGPTLWRGAASSLQRQPAASNRREAAVSFHRLPTTLRLQLGGITLAGIARGISSGG